MRGRQMKIITWVEEAEILYKCNSEHEGLVATHFITFYMTSSWIAVEIGVEILLLEASQISKLFRCILPICLSETLLTTLLSILKTKSIRSYLKYTSTLIGSNYTEI